MKLNQFLLSLILGGLLYSCQPTSKNILVFISPDLDYATSQYYKDLSDEIILNGNQQLNFDHWEDLSNLSEQDLQAYDGVAFLGHNGDEISVYQRAFIERYIQAGGNFIGINALSNTDRHWLWYGQLVGATLSKDENKPSIHFMSDNDAQQLDINVPNGQYWMVELDGGKSLQIAFPIRDDGPKANQIAALLGDKITDLVAGTQLDYSKATTDLVPEENRFTKRTLVDNLYEPMELDVLPDGKILFVERRGDLHQYDPVTEQFDSITTLPVHTKFEDGLMGIAVDPNYEENHWIYLYYSPVGDKPIQHLSRFSYQNDQLDYDSEKVVMVVDVQRDECCHSGGSLEFGPDGLLYLSTGDDTNPFASNGFSPIDERPDRSPWDAQKSSANTNDLRGKILRIKPESDGTYSIPEGNLFAKDQPNTRPEIYVMGCRNPFRISIDSRTNFLYWGDVGPDSGKDKEDRGPRGIDEINQARTPGFWGWPYTRGNNIVYTDYNFTKEESGQPFIPDNLINDSPNNTGLTRLPPAQKSMIWYGYGQSEDFPWVSKGGKNPMAGPIYYSEDFEGDQKFPAYFDGKLIAYEWMRHWIYVITMDENHNYVKAEPFLPNTEFSRPMDMVFDRKGRLFVLEYGPKWFAKNKEASLSIIEFNGGNRAPIAELTAEEQYGSVPFLAKLSAEASKDYDNDQLSFAWKVDGKKIPGNKSTLEINLEDEGTYEVEVMTTDPSGASATKKYTLYAGNAAPVVAWEIKGNQSFFWPGRELNYEVTVQDLEDGNQIKDDRLSIAFDYLPLGEDITLIAQGHAAQMSGAQIALGAALIDQSDCKVCHGINKKIAGPSYHEIAKHYQDKPDANTYLANKIIKGGGGVWGETVMAAHPDLKEEEALSMAAYVLSLTDLEKEEETIAQSGKYTLEGADETGQYILWTAYTDGGSEHIDPITIEDRVKLRHFKLQAENYDAKSDPIETSNFDGGKYLSGFRHGDFFGFQDIDLTDVKSIRIKMRRGAGGSLAFNLDNLKQIPVATVPIDGKRNQSIFLQIPLENVSGFHDLFFTTLNPASKAEWIGAIDWLEFVFDQNEEMLSID